eukprot:g38033.t1
MFLLHFKDQLPYKDGYRETIAIPCNFASKSWNCFLNGIVGPPHLMDAVTQKGCMLGCKEDNACDMTPIQFIRVEEDRALEDMGYCGR